MCRALFLPLHRAAFFQASSPACLRTEGRAGAMPALPKCRVICVLPSLFPYNEPIHAGRNEV